MIWMLAPTFLGGGLLVTGAIRFEFEVEAAAAAGEWMILEVRTVRKLAPAW